MNTTHTYIQRDVRRHTYTPVVKQQQTHIHTHTDTYTRRHTHTHTHTHAQTHTLTHTHTHTGTDTDKYTQTRIHRQANLLGVYLDGYGRTLCNRQHHNT